MIAINKINETTFEVTVQERTTTIHIVTLPSVYYEKLTGKKVTQEVLIERSFEFLLQRESNTSILSSFELSVIGTYFPEYENKIKKML